MFLVAVLTNGAARFLDQDPCALDHCLAVEIRDRGVAQRNIAFHIEVAVIACVKKNGEQLVELHVAEAGGKVAVLAGMIIVHVEDFRMIADKIKILHVDDNHACEDRHLAPGFGNVQFNELLPILFNAGYDGYFNMECNIPLRNPAITDLYCEAMVKCARILIEEAGGTVG